MWSEEPCLFSRQNNIGDEGNQEGAIKEKRGKNLQVLLFLLHFELVLNWALLTGCKATGACYSIISQYRTVSHHDFHALTKLVWRPAASALSSKWEQVAGQTGMLGGCARTTWTMFVEQSIRQMFNLLFVGEKLWIVLKACPISHHLFIVCPHPLISS